jgi:hypothetical protein
MKKYVGIAHSNDHPTKMEYYLKSLQGSRAIGTIATQGENKVSKI